MMKSNRTGLGSLPQFLTIHLAILFILVNCLILLVQSRGDDAQGEIELINWINLSQNNWPQKDADSDDEFLVYHSEYSSNLLFGLNKEFFQDVDLVSKPELYFRYWANAESSFRSRVNHKSSTPTRDVKLTGDRKWHSSLNLKSISPEEWPTFAFVQQDVFTLALKDLKVKYVEKLHLDKLDKLEVTAYNVNPNHENFKENYTIKNSGIIHFNAITATFDLATLNASSIKFELGQQQVSTPITIVATDNKTNIPSEFKSLFSVTLDSTNIKVLKAVKITLPKLGFTISKISYKEVNSTAETVLSPEDFIKSISGKLFTQVSQSQVKGHVQFTDHQPTDFKTSKKDICYSIQKLNEKSNIEVYLTLRGAPVGIKLDTLEVNENKKEICLYDYIALQNLGNYMMTFVLSGISAAQSQFQFQVKTSYKDSQQKNLFIPEGEVKNGFQWLYYNPQAFDYSIEIEDNNSESANFLICDLVANCYPYESKDNNRKYILPESVRKELDQTPFVRIVASYSSTTGNKIPKFTNNVIERFNSKLLTDNAKSILNGKPSDLQFEIKFDDQNEAAITVPIDLVDLRAQLLAIDVKLNTSDIQSRLTLLNLSYKIATESEAYNFPLDQFPQVQTKHFHLASDQLFDYAPSSIPTPGNSVSLTVRLNSPNVQPKPKVILKFEIKSFNRNLIKGKFSFKNDPKDGSKSSGIQIYPVDLLKDKDFKDSNKKELLLPANKNRLLITNWIQAGTYQKLLNSELKTSFTVTPKTNGDISNITLHRVILRSQGYPEFVELKESTNQTKNSVTGKMEITFVDDITKDDDKWKMFPTKGTFRIGYFIHSGENFDATIVVNQFNVQGTEFGDSVNNCLKEATVAYRDCHYEESSCPFGGDFNGNTCNLKKLNRFVETKCDMTVGCSNILDRRLSVSASYAVDPNVSEYVPFQIEGQEEEQHYLKYKRPTKFLTGDFCLAFTYQAKKSPLVVSASLSNSSLGISFPITELISNGAKICASWLTNEVDSINELYFRFVRTPLYEIDSHKVKFTKASAGESEPALPEGIYIDKLAKSQFIFITPNDRLEYSFTVNEHGNSLKATFSKERLQTLLSNTQKDNYSAYVSTFRTKWIKLAKSGEPLKIGFDVKNTDVHKVSKIQLKIYSAFKQIWEADISAFKSNEILSVKEASVFGQYYQVEVMIELNQTKIREIEKSIYWDFVMTLENFSINDPCVNSANKVEECSGVKQGTCVRSYLESNYSGICECKSFYYGTQCELEDYCKQEGQKICGKKELCKNDVENRQISCECEMPNQIWSAFLKSCINPQDLICSGPNEILQYVHKKPTCVCMAGFVSFNQTCAAFDICNPIHRGIRSLKPPNPCQAIPNSKCEPNENKPNGFACPCKSDFFWDTLNSKCLPENPCKSCEHRCNNIPSGGVEYKCDENCNNGYVYNEESKECEISDTELQNLSTNLGCPERKIELKDGKPACVCGDQMFDPITRGCSQSECSPEMLANCQLKGAIACKWAPFSWARTKGTPVCICKEGDIAYSDSQNSSSAWQCMSRCDVLELPKQYRSRCTEPFSYCDPKKPFRNYVPNKGLQKAGWIEGVFQVNQTELDPTDKSHCECEFGFRKDDNSTGKCVPYERPIHTITDMEFDWNPYKEETEYLSDVKLAFKSLIIQVLEKSEKKSEKKSEIGELFGTKCVKKENETIISCSTNFESDQEDSAIVGRIKNACVYAGTGDGKCFYLNLDTNLPKSQPKQSPELSRNKRDASISSSSELSILVQDKSKQNNLQVQQKDICATANICSKYSYSSCTSAEVKPFQCLCPKVPYFKVASSEPLGSQQQLNMETCEVVDLCHDSEFSCKESDSTCTFHVERSKSDGEYSPKSYCSCAKTNITLASHEHSCKTSCDGQCIHSDGCAQDYQTNKMICHCTDGWTGEKCDTKLTESTASKAYLISIIVVSIIAVAELIGLGVIYFRRR